MRGDAGIHLGKGRCVAVKIEDRVAHLLRADAACFRDQHLMLTRELQKHLLGDLLNHDVIWSGDRFRVGTVGMCTGTSGAARGERDSQSGQCQVESVGHGESLLNRPESVGEFRYESLCEKTDGRCVSAD